MSGVFRPRGLHCHDKPRRKGRQVVLDRVAPELARNMFWEEQDEGRTV
jgi:hypothetical protein